jgi:hypothetical protein
MSIHNTAEDNQKLKCKLVEYSLFFNISCGPDLDGQTGTGMWQYKNSEAYQKKKGTTQDPKVWTLKDSSECITNVPLY